MKVVALMGSPRPQGNTMTLLQEVLKKAAETGAEVKLHQLNQMDIKGCQSCYACKQQPTCVIRDDGKQLLADIADADAVVFGTPVYMWDMTAQTKLAIDRLYSFLNSDYSSKLKPGKKVLWTITQGNPDEKLFAGAFEKTSKMLQFIGFGEYKILIASGVKTPEDFLGQPKIQQQVSDMGAWLTS